MALFSSNENRIKCGRCNTEFDINKNKEGCPLCGFGKNSSLDKSGKALDSNEEVKSRVTQESDYLSIPAMLNLPKGKIIADSESKFVGFWGMFNDFFSGKALLRINANMIYKNKTEYVTLFDLIETSKEVIYQKDLHLLKGFPNDIKSESSVNRLIYHFVAGFHKIGLFEVKLEEGESEKDNIWNEKWESISIRPTKEGLEFARIKNRVFDEHKTNKEDQFLTNEERIWMIDYLKNIDKQGFKEYSTLKDVYLFIKSGKNGKDDLWNWFKRNSKFISYLKEWSSKSDDEKAFEKQITNLAQTFSASKVSLLRELGLIKNKRDDYTIIGELE